MLDPRSLGDRRDEIAESCRDRGVAADVDAAIALHERVTAIQTELNETNRRRNEHQASGKRKMEDAERQAHTAEGRALKEAVARVEAELAGARSRFEAELVRLPNFIHPDSPRGGEEAFRELRRVGTPGEFPFGAKDHLELARLHDLVDFETGAQIAGQKWYYLKNEAALLEIALQRYALDFLLEEGFTPYVTPDVARPDLVSNIGFNPRGEETQIYSIEGEDLCLVGTAEIPLGGLFADRILEEDDLPVRVAGVSHCFRTEAGAAGRESKGLYRVHQFTKVEMFVVTRPEDSEAMHEELVRIEERIFQGLELPYRVIDIPSGDLGAPAYRKLDIEAWMPGRGEGGDWGEISSASNCTDYQSRRLKSRFKRKGGKRNEFVHMLNGTAVSNARTILSILENHQQPDGSIAIPKALAPYVGRERIGGGG